MNKIRCYERKHAGGLIESLETIKEINPKQFAINIKNNKVHYYGYDERINQHLWIDEITYTWYCIGTRKDIETYINTHENK